MWFSESSSRSTTPWTRSTSRASNSPLNKRAILLVTTNAAPWLLHKGQHVRIDLMLQKIPRSIGWGCELFVDALGFARYSGDPIYGLVAKDRYAERNDVETFDSLGATRVESTAPITKEVHLA